MAGVTTIQAYLNGSFTEHVRGLNDIEVDTSFKSDSRSSEVVQPVITVNKLTFVGPAAQTIINYQLGGLDGSTPGILEGLPLQLYANNGVSNELIFDGYIDFKDYEQINPVEVVCNITEAASMNSFDVVSKVTFFNILAAKGVYTNSDYVNINYIVEKLDAEGEAASVAIMLYVLSVQIIQQVEKLQERIANIAAHTTGGITGPISGIIYAVALAVIDLIILIQLIKELAKLIFKLAALFAPPVRTHKGIYQFNLLENAINSLGYDFETGIDLMKKTAYLPARPELKNNIPVGVPKPGQAGQTLAEFIEIMLLMYDAKVAILDNTVHIRSANDPFWVKNSSYILPDFGDEDENAVNLQSERKVFNIADFNANRKISFADDVSDEYTANIWKGTNFMVITEPINVNNKKHLLMDGLDDINIPVALGNNKEGLNEVEFALFNVFSIADGLNNLFGGNSNFTALITDRRGALKLSQTVFNIPKFIYLENGIIPVNHREKLSAKVLYENFHARKSFVNTKPVLNFLSSDGTAANYEDTAPANWGNQKQLFNNLAIRFTQSDYLKVKKNSYFATSDGTPGEIEKSKWLTRSVKAVQTFSIFKIWTSNLKEIFIEPI